MATKRRMTNQELIEHLGLQNESHDNIRKMGFGGLLKGIGGIAGMIPGVGTAIGAGLNLAGGVADGIEQNKQQQAQQSAMEAQQNKQNAMQNFQQAQQPVKLSKGGSINNEFGDDKDTDFNPNDDNTNYTMSKSEGMTQSTDSNYYNRYEPNTEVGGINSRFEKKFRGNSNIDNGSNERARIQKEIADRQGVIDRLDQAEAKTKEERQQYSNDTNNMSSLGMRGTSLQELKRPEQTIDKPEDTGYEYWNDKGRTFRLRKGDDEKNMEISKDGNKFFKVQSLRGGLMNIGSHGEDARPKVEITIKPKLNTNTALISDDIDSSNETKPVIPHTDDNGEIIGYKSSTNSKVVYRRNPISGKVEVLSKRGKPVKEGGLREAIILRKEKGAIDESKEGELESIGIPVYKKK